MKIYESELQIPAFSGEGSPLDHVTKSVVANLPPDVVKLALWVKRRKPSVSGSVLSSNFANARSKTRPASTSPS